MTDLNFEIFPIEELNVESWSPGTVAENIPPTEVHLFIRIKGKSTPLVMRMKSKAAVNELIDALIEHRDVVWPTTAKQLGEILSSGRAHLEMGHGEVSVVPHRWMKEVDQIPTCAMKGCTHPAEYEVPIGPDLQPICAMHARVGYGSSIGLIRLVKKTSAEG